MKEFSKVVIRISSLLLSLLMIVGIFAAVSISANAATQTKVEKSYEIAVVFDNSGSMYSNQAWCRAKYAMEIFASMLNYDNGDKLRIYPMWEVTTDGSKPKSGGSYAAIQIDSKDSIDKISNMYTVAPDGTPYAPVTEAYNYLKKSKATDKWMIVLTDGRFNLEKRIRNGKEISIDLQGRLTKLASEEINVQYLGFSGALELQENKAKHFFAKKSDEKTLKDDLIKICNSIFQRSELPNDRLSGKTLNLDLSMNNLIAFVQGPNAKIKSLKDSNGKEVNISLNSGQRKYSNIIAGGEYSNAPVDKTLAGQVVTFSDCHKGKYTLDYSGAEAIQFFYEPNVDIKVTLTNSDGEEVDGSKGEIAPGDYTISSKIVDSKTGDDVTNHKLMGNEVKLTTKVKRSDDSDYKEYANGAKITFEPDSSTDIQIVGTYLKDYTITSEGSPELSWLSGIKIDSPDVNFKIKASVQQSQSWYNTKDYENWKPIKVSMTIDGKPLTDEQMKNTKLSFSTSDDLKYRYEALDGESAYNVYIAQDENGKYVEPDYVKHKLDVSGVYVDKYGKETAAKDSVTFDIKWYGKFWQWLKWLIIFAIIIGALVFILTRKAWPHKMTCITSDGKRKPVRIGKNMCLIPINSALNVKAEKNSILLYKFSRKASIKVTYSGTKPYVESFRISGRSYTKSSDFKIKGKPYSGIICGSTKFDVAFNDGKASKSGRIQIN